MAEATKSTRTVTTTEDVFTLTLSTEEFSWLKTLVGDQDGGDGMGASARVWDAMMSPAETPKNPTTYEYENVAYDLTRQYRDSSGDPWYFTGVFDTDGMPLMSCREGGDDFANWPLSRVVARYSSFRAI